jgi:transcription elongation GreA/GreB family factor
MSVAFTREDSAETASEVELPDRLVSPHPNFVTHNGLELLKQAMAAANSAFISAQTIEDINERRRASAPAARDLRYFAARLKSAQLKAAPTEFTTLAFGHRVRFHRSDGRTQTFQIVGEDEANPATGSMSYVSPIARALMGKRIGDAVTVNGQDIEIVEIT